MWMSALRRLLFSVVAITSCFHCLDADAASPTEIRDRNKDSTVYIQVSGAGKDGVPYEVDATGFMVSATGLPQDWGSGGDRHWRAGSVGWLELLSEAGTERAIVDGAADLQQQVGPVSRPAHLL